jgi:hypothetical protein
VALALHKWDTTGQNGDTLYVCKSHDRAVLKKHSFDCYALSLDPGFTMSKGTASFGVSGTD